MAKDAGEKADAYTSLQNSAMRKAPIGETKAVRRGFECKTTHVSCVLAGSYGGLVENNT